MSAQVDQQAASSTETGITATHTSGEQTSIHPMEVLVQLNPSFFLQHIIFFISIYTMCKIVRIPSEDTVHGYSNLA